MNHHSQNNKVGRPTVMTKAVLQKLRGAYLVDCIDEEAAFWAGIAPATLYNYQNKNPQFLESKQSWKLNTTIRARITLAKAIESDANFALKYLERKKPEEFSPHYKTDNSLNIPQIEETNKLLNAIIDLGPTRSEETP